MSPTLQAFASSLEAFRDRSTTKSKKRNGLTTTLTQWEEVFQSAQNASKTCRDADKKHADGIIADTNSIAQEGMDALASRYVSLD
jgi:hypothetical protein